MKDSRVIVVTGTPGTGKTKFARLLAKKLDIDSINLTEFAIQHDLIERYDPERKTHVVDERRLTRELERYLKTLKRQVLVEGHYSGQLTPKRFTEVVFVLRCDPEILKRRLKRRSYSDKKIRENVEAEVLDVCLSEAISTQGRGRIAELDTSARTVESCVEEAVKVLNRKKSKQAGKCNWLAELERRGKLDKFLKEHTVAWRRKSS